MQTILLLHVMVPGRIKIRQWSIGLVISDANIVAPFDKAMVHVAANNTAIEE